MKKASLGVRSPCSQKLSQSIKINKQSLIMLKAVHKLRLHEDGGKWSKKLTFCKFLSHRKCKRRGVGGQKEPNLVNIV